MYQGEKDIRKIGITLGVGVVALEEIDAKLEGIERHLEQIAFVLSNQGGKK